MITTVLYILVFYSIIAQETQITTYRHGSKPKIYLYDYANILLLGSRSARAIHQLYSEVTYFSFKVHDNLRKIIEVAYAETKKFMRRHVQRRLMTLFYVR
jgi:hypothetical protein